MSNDLIRIAEDSARGSFFLISGASIATVVSAITTILVGRFLGPELYGQYALSLVIPQMLLLFRSTPKKSLVEYFETPKVEALSSSQLQRL